MRKISAQQLKDFQTCALLYAYRHGVVETSIKESPDVRERRALRFDETIRRVAAFFFYKKQSMSEPSYQALQNRWQKLWFAEGTQASDIAAMRNEVAWANDVSYTSQAASALLQFYNDFSDKPSQEVILIDEPFYVPLNKYIALTGLFDLVTRTKKEDGTYRYDVYKWITSNFKRSPTFWVFDLAMLDYAFRYRNDNAPLDAHYHLWNFGSSMPGDKEILIEKKDIDLLKYWANQLDMESVFAPRRGLTSYCKSCPYDMPCSKWEVPVKTGDKK